LRTFSVAGVALALLSSAPALSAAPDAEAITPELQRVRQALDKYRDAIRAVHDGHLSTAGCVEYPKAGAPGQVPYPAGGMGVHFFNVGLMGKFDPLQPQVLVYEPSGGKLRLVAAEYFVPLSPDLKERPQLFGRPFDRPMAGHHPLMPHDSAITTCTSGSGKRIPPACSRRRILR